MNGDSSHSEWEQSVENFPGSIPVLPCCEADLSLRFDLSLLFHPSEGGWFGSLGSSSVGGAAAVPQGAPQSLAAVPLPLLSPTWCSCCFSAPSQGMDALLALTIPPGAAKISDLVQEEPVPPSHGAQPGLSSALPSPGSSWRGQGWAWPCARLILVSVLWCWSSEGWKAAVCGGQAEPPTSTCPGITDSLACFWV